MLEDASFGWLVLPLSRRGASAKLQTPTNSWPVPDGLCSGFLAKLRSLLIVSDSPSLRNIANDNSTASGPYAVFIPGVTQPCQQHGLASCGLEERNDTLCGRGCHSFPIRTGWPAVIYRKRSYSDTFQSN